MTLIGFFEAKLLRGRMFSSYEIVSGRICLYTSRSPPLSWYKLDIRVVLVVATFE